MTRETTIRAPRAPARFEIGDPALFVDDGQAEPVTIDSEEFPHEASGEPMRYVLDAMGVRYEVKANLLAPVRQPPPALATPRSPRVGSADKDGGRVYAPEPYQAHAPRSHPVMEKFERLHDEPPVNTVLRAEDLDKSTATRLANAEREMGNKDPHIRANARDRLLALQRREEAKAASNDQAAASNERLALSIGRRALDAADQITARRRELVAMGVNAAGIEMLIERFAAHLARINERMAAGNDRNGLDKILAAGTITKAEHFSGEKYRELFEARAATHLRIANLEGAGGGSGRNGQESLTVAQLGAGDAADRLEAMVAAEVPGKRAVWVLKLVAGEGRCLAHFSKSAGRAKNAWALKQALHVLACHWGLQ